MATELEILLAKQARLKQGVKIEWLKPLAERNYDNLVENVDFIYLNQNMPCTRGDGEPMDFSGMVNAENMEWLIKEIGKPAELDYRQYAENIASRPTNIPDIDFPNYNKFVVSYDKVRLPKESIITAIRKLESEANAMVMAEGESVKAQMLSHDVYDKRATGELLTPEEQSIFDRLKQMNAIGLVNATNAESLIAIVNEGGTPNIDEGWMKDSIVSVGYPFKL